jgi:hypothetical protein
MIDMHERELWSIAAFRLRESAKRIYALSSHVASPHLRAELLSIYVRLRADEDRLSAWAGQIPADTPALTLTDSTGATAR